MSRFKELLNKIGDKLVEFQTNRNPEIVNAFPHSPNCSKTRGIFIPSSCVRDEFYVYGICPECHISALIK